MSKCICKQIAELAEKHSSAKIYLCTGHSGISGYVDADATKEMDGILILKSAKVQCRDKEPQMVDCIGVSGLHIVSFHCGECDV